MNPRVLHARSYRRFAELDLTLPQGVTAIVGPNGAGKSALVELIELCLFADGARDLAPWLTTGEDELLVGMECDHGGELYRVRRTYSGRGRARATLDFEVWKNDGIAEEAMAVAAAPPRIRELAMA